MGSARTIESDFIDDDGNLFSNISRYTCYTNDKIGTGIANKYQALQDTSTSETVNVPMATQFCTRTKDGQTDTDNCFGTIGTTNSAASYPQSLFVSSNIAGSVNLSNNNYKCFAVEEPIRGSTGVGNQARPYPLDSTFALSKFPSESFPVGVVAPSVLGISNDPTSASTLCFQETSNNTPTGGNPNAISTKCIGYAAKPTGGSCPQIKTSNGLTVPTYRLRRYVSIFQPTLIPTEK